MIERDQLDFRITLKELTRIPSGCDADSLAIQIGEVVNACFVLAHEQAEAADKDLVAKVVFASRLGRVGDEQQAVPFACEETLVRQFRIHLPDLCRASEFSGQSRCEI